jgi:hypothetical protein
LSTPPAESVNLTDSLRTDALRLWLHAAHARSSRTRELADSWDTDEPALTSLFPLHRRTRRAKPSLFLIWGPGLSDEAPARLLPIHEGERDEYLDRVCTGGIRQRNRERLVERHCGDPLTAGSRDTHAVERAPSEGCRVDVSAEDELEVIVGWRTQVAALERDVGDRPVRRLEVDLEVADFRSDPQRSRIGS